MTSSSRSGAAFRFKSRLYAAVTNDMPEDLQQLLMQDGADPDMKIMGKMRAVHYAVRRDDPQCFDVLVAAGATMDMPPVGRENPLFDRASNGDVRAVSRLLAAGANPETCRDRSPRQRQHILHVVCRMPSPSLLQRLLDGGGWQALDYQNDNQRTPTEVLAMSLRNAEHTPSTHAAFERMQQLMARYERMPQLELKQITSKQQLFEINDDGFCLLDHPRTWKAWPQIVENLALHGQWIHKSDLLRPDADGRNWMVRATECMAFASVLQTLHAQGETIGKAELLDPRGEPTELMDALRDYDQLKTTFGFANWRQQPLSQLQDVLAQMDETEVTRCVPHYHALTTAIRRENIQQGMGRL